MTFTNNLKKLIRYLQRGDRTNKSRIETVIQLSEKKNIPNLRNNSQHGPITVFPHDLQSNQDRCPIPEANGKV